MLGVKWYWGIGFCDNLCRPLLLITLIYFVYYLLSCFFETIHSNYSWDMCAKPVCLHVLLLIVKNNIHEIGVGAVCLIIVAWKKIYYYYFIGASLFARSVMMQTGVKIANYYFPFGTEWGTFGSYYSEKYYSPVFRIYGLGLDSL